MKNYRVIDTNLVYKILDLKEDNFKQLKNYIEDFCKMFFNGKRRSWADFVDGIMSEIEIEYGKGYTSYRTKAKADYRNVILKYPSLLKELVEKEVLFDLFRIISNKEDYAYFVEIYDDLVLNYDKKEIMKENLYRLKKLEIDSFCYEPDINLEGDYEIYVRENDKNGNYAVRGVCSDGKKIWEAQMQSGTYSFYLKAPKYVIQYNKNTLTPEKVVTVVKSLDFDGNTLPTYEELYDKKVCPVVDYSEIGKKTMAYNSICESIEIKEDISLLTKKIEDFLYRYNASLLDEEEIESLERQILVLRKPYLLFEKLSGDLVSRYDETGVLDKDKLYRKIYKRRNR